MWCCRVPGRVFSPPRLTTPSSPSPSPVWFSTRLERPTSASWWMFTVSHTVLLSTRSDLWPTTAWSQTDKTNHCCVSFSEQRLSLSPTALLLEYNKELSLFLSPVGPILLVEPQPKTVDVDSDVSLNCKWAGNPPLTLTWFKKGSNMVGS